MANRSPPATPRASGSSARSSHARAHLHEDDAVIQRDLGLVQLLSDRFDPAADALQISMGLEPDQPSVRFLLALARLGQRRVDEARALLKQVPPADPYLKLAQERLKQLEPLQR